MDVQLYVYDLTQGLARQVSRQLLGTHIDAVYHTSLVFNGVEYFFGRGIQTCYPGTTHHGRPMEVLKLGQTSLPEDVIAEYLDSLRETYTAESYDLFMHNCNNFTHDFATFLVGKGIPDHITSLPRTVLNTPFGQMLRPQLDSAMRNVTQAEVPPQAIPSRRQPSAPSRNVSNGTSSNNGTHSKMNATLATGRVHNVTSLSELNRLLEASKTSCATIFFTSSTCAPCKLAYPTFDDLAQEHGPRCTLIKVDINTARDIAMSYSIRATPTFMTFLKGQKSDEWTGADPGKLRTNVDALVTSAFPPHPHGMLKLPTFSRQSRRPVTYTKVPPLEKLRAKMGEASNDPIVANITDFITKRSQSGSTESPPPPLPNLAAFSTFLRDSLTKVPTESLFASYDLLRLILADPRAAGFFAEETNNNTLFALFNHLNYTLSTSCPYNLRLVSLHLACNLFSSPIFASAALASTSNALVSLASAALLSAGRDDDSAGALTPQNKQSLATAAACLALNIATAVLEQRSTDKANTQKRITQDTRVELAASLIEFLSSVGESTAGSTETTSALEEAVKAAVLALGRLVYFADSEGGSDGDGEVLDLCRAMDAREVVAGAKKSADEDGKLVDEVAKELMGKGLDVAGR